MKVLKGASETGVTWAEAGGGERGERERERGSESSERAQQRDESKWKGR
jgi:hypothetical protein